MPVASAVGSQELRIALNQQPASALALLKQMALV